MLYTVKIENKSGAVEMTKTDTKKECQDVVNAWADPENLRVEVLHEGADVGYKAYGRKRIVWSPN